MYLLFKESRTNYFDVQRVLKDFNRANPEFLLIQGLNQGSKNKIPIIGTALVNLSEYVSAAEEKELELNIPLTSCGMAPEPCSTLCVCAYFFLWKICCFSFLFLII